MPTAIDRLLIELRNQPMIVAEIELALDGVECGYRIVRLTDDRHAFVWGNIAAGVNDELPAEHHENPTAEKGVYTHQLFADCLKDWREAGEALRDSYHSHLAHVVLFAISHFPD